MPMGGGGSTIGGSSVLGSGHGGGMPMSAGISSSTVGGMVGSGGVGGLVGAPPGMMTSGGGIGGGVGGGTPGNNGGVNVGGVMLPGGGCYGGQSTAPGSVVDSRAVSVVVTLPGPQHGQALSDYGPI